MKLCSVQNCTNKHLAKGYCSLHWQRHKFSREMLPPNCRSCINEYQVDDLIATLWLTYRGSRVACLIDAVDLSLVQAVGQKFYGHKAQHTKHIYAVSRSIVGTTWLHRLLLGVSDVDLVVDHISGDTLDNRRCNLRVCSFSFNTLNQHGLRTNNTSGFTNVWFSSQKQKWVAEVMVDGKKQHLGCYKTPEMASSVAIHHKQKVLNAKA